MPPSRQTNPWTFEQRLCLDVLWTGPFTNLSLKDRAKAHNAIFNDEFSASGASHGRTTTAISAQYSERMYTHKPSWQAAWERVCAVPKRDLELREEFQRKINEVLQRGEDDRVEEERPATPPPPPPGTPRRTERSRKTTQNSYDWYADPEPATPVHQRRSSTQHDVTAAPYATPGPSTRKRPAATPSRFTVEDDLDELNGDDGECVPRTKRSRRISPDVVIQPCEEIVLTNTIVTPTKSTYRSGPREGATMLLHRFDGAPIWLTPAEYAEAMLPLVNVTEEAAHPNPPAMLFRFWHAKSHGINSETAFVSGRFSRILVEPRGPPSCDVLEWNDVAHHLNNAGNDQTGVPSPFISTANLLVWIVRMMLKAADESACISIMDTSQLDPKAIYHVPPFYKALKKKRCFFKGGFNYQGSHEHLIWDRIPGNAIVNTITLRGIITFAEGNRAVRRVLRLDKLASAKSSATEITKTLKRDNVRIDGLTAAAIAETVIFLGLSHLSSIDMLSRAVHEIVQGWALKADGESQEEWDHFVQVFVDKSGFAHVARHVTKLQQA